MVRQYALPGPPPTHIGARAGDPHALRWAVADVHVHQDGARQRGLPRSGGGELACNRLSNFSDFLAPFEMLIR